MPGVFDLALQELLGYERFSLNQSSPTFQCLARLVALSRSTRGRGFASLCHLSTPEPVPFDPLGSLKTLTDGNNHFTTWAYDDFGNLTNKVDARGTNILRLQYDAALRLTNRWTAAKGATTYKYNAAGSVTNVVYPVSPSLTFGYDALERLSALSDAVGTSGFTYYVGTGQVVSENGPFSDDLVVTTYFDHMPFQLSLTQPYGPALVQSYTYDLATRRLTNTISIAGAFSYKYGGAGSASPLISKIGLPNGSYRTNTYDSLARLTGTYLKDSGNNILDLAAYGYNLANLRTNLTLTAGNLWTFTYDNANQLKMALGSEWGGTSRLHEQYGFVYDAAGNLTTRTNNALLETFTPDSLNQLSSVSRSGTLTVAGTTTANATSVTVNSTNTASRYSDATFAAVGFSPLSGNNTYTTVASDSLGRSDTNSVTVNLTTPASFAYDANGNMTSDGQHGFDYDDENQLIRITTTNSLKSEFTYDGFGRMRTRKEFSWQSSAWVQASETRYIYDGNVVIQERDGNNIPKVTYTRGLDLSGTRQGAGGIGGLLARTDNSLYVAGGSGAHAFYHSDGLGSTTALLNDHQALVGKYAYAPYGGTISQSGSMAGVNTSTYMGMFFHQPSGLIYYGGRWYNPTLQRWMNADPSGISGGLNLHDFAGNNPVNFIDPDGNNPLLITAAIGAGVGALIGGGMALWNDPHASLGNVLASAGKGAAIGGLVGLTGGLAFDSALAAAGLSAATATPLQLATAGAIGAGFGDMTGQSAAGALGWQDGYDPAQTALSMAFGFGGGYGLGKFCPAAPESSGLGPEDLGPTEAYNRAKHYGRTPTGADRKAVGVGSGEVADHQPSLVERYYEGDPSIGEKPGWQMTPEERKLSAGDRNRMQPQPMSDSNSQGGYKSQYSKRKRRELGL